MREGIRVEVSAAERGQLETIVADRNSPQKHVWRARIALLTADGLGTNEIMRQAGTSKVTVWRWQERFMRAGGGSEKTIFEGIINALKGGNIYENQTGFHALGYGSRAGDLFADRSESVRGWPHLPPRRGFLSVRWRRIFYIHSRCCSI